MNVTGKDPAGYNTLSCPCGRRARIVGSMVGSYVHCPWCDRSTIMQNTEGDAVRLWENMNREEMKMREENKIVNIRIDEIYPHPDNPRKNLGDLTELAESIRKNGIMQNLTVIPGHWMAHEEWEVCAREYHENPSEELRRRMNAIHTGD